ncbi:beta-galactosidase trimerization domain-containing protein [Paenibacillus sp. FSL R7-0179]|uniref:beta-galactosidase trimerization domain-containing protein n=1 Tax=Paenibacillus sp. FSL R7-0179 TaxID=2921672 RepID=UPI0030F640AF
MRFIRRDAEGNLYACSQWCDILRLESAQPIAWYEDDYYAGVPAATVNRFGAGKVYYIGTYPGENYWLKLLGDIALDAGLEQFEELPEGVQVFKRTGENRELLFLLNLSRTAQNIRLDKNYRSALTGTLETGTVMLPPFAVQILQAVSGGRQ